MNKFIVALFIILSLLFSAKNYGSVTVNKVVSVYDGDTIRVNIAHYPPILGDNISIRILGIDTPELRTKNLKEKQLAYKAKEYVETIIKNSKTIVLKDMQRDKYFRILANVDVDGKDLGQMLIDKGYAVKYDGGKKKSWSEILKK